MSKVAIAGMWDMGYDSPLTEYQRWFHMQREFLVDEWYMTPVSGIAKKGLIEVPDMETAIVQCMDEGYTIVVLDEKGTASLQEFEHPDKTLYVMGKAGKSFMTTDKLSLKIPTPRDSGGLWPHQAISVVLYDRYCKK